MLLTRQPTLSEVRGKVVLLVGDEGFEYEKEAWGQIRFLEEFVWLLRFGKGRREMRSRNSKKINSDNKVPR